MSKKSKPSTRPILIIIVACLLELLMLSIWKKRLDSFWSPIVTLASGLIAGIGFLYFFYKKEIHLNNTFTFDIKKGILAFSIFVAGILICGSLLNDTFLQFPINASTDSDVIPQIKILVTRFLSGVFPYQLITEWSFNHTLYPTYLPLTWMPFILPEVLGFDYRWMAFSVLMISFLFYFSKILSWNISWKGILFLGITSFYFLYAYQKGEIEEGIFRNSVETLIAGYYLILALSIFSKSNILKGAALTFCLLSRYSVVLWVPLFFFVLFFASKENKYKIKTSDLLTIGFIMFAGFLIFYAIPFLSEDTSIFIKGYDYHTDAALQSWKTSDWQPAEDPPFALFKGFGMAGFFYEYVPGDLETKLKACQRFHFIASIFTVILLGGIFYKIKNKIDYRIFLLGSLKIYLVIFYNFIQIPFNYLFLTLVMVSLPMIGLLVRQYEQEIR